MIYLLLRAKRFLFMSDNKVRYLLVAGMAVETAETTVLFKVEAEAVPLMFVGEVKPLTTVSLLLAAVGVLQMPVAVLMVVTVVAYKVRMVLFGAALLVVVEHKLLAVRQDHLAALRPYWQPQGPSDREEMEVTVKLVV